ncbi:MAG: hypothetical protein HYU37_09825 [Acidobacteria bacterium]|nr:hypothetical protein [Acidobacteriota bacterium]
MRKNPEYLLKLDSAPSFDPKDGDISTIYDWSGGTSFTVISIVSSKSPWAATVHVRATADNAYGSSNFANSRLRYNSADRTRQESREIIGVTPLSGAAT